MTRGLNDILDRDGNEDDIVAFITVKELPSMRSRPRASRRLFWRSGPCKGYLTISNALQWRLQYGRVITQAGLVEGVTEVR